MKKGTLLILISLIITGILYSQDLQPPVGYGITSDYGARNMTSYDWHDGIDYGSPMWTDIEAVEGGDIIDIVKYIHSGWGIGIEGSNATWFYYHLFQEGNNPISPDSSYEAIIFCI